MSDCYAYQTLGSNREKSTHHRCKIEENPPIMSKNWVILGKFKMSIFDTPPTLIFPQGSHRPEKVMQIEFFSGHERS